MAVTSSNNQTSARKLKNEMNNVDLTSVEASASNSPDSSMSVGSTPPSSVESQSQRSGGRQKAPRVHDLEAEEEEVIEVIDLTRPERVTSYPQPDCFPRVPGVERQLSFELPTLQRLVSRSSASVERSQNRSRGSIEILEIADDDDEDEWDRYGRNTVRIDSEVREVQLDARHPWAQGPIELISRPLYRDSDRTLEGRRQRQLIDVVDVEDREEEEDDDCDVTENSTKEWAVDLQRASEPISTSRQRTSKARARSHTLDTRPQSHSFMAPPISFPTTSRQAGRVPRIKSTSQHRYTPVARPPSPVPLILGSEELPSASTTSSSRSSRAFRQVSQSTQASLQSSQSSTRPVPSTRPTVQWPVAAPPSKDEPLQVLASPKQLSSSPEPSPPQPHSVQQPDTSTPYTSAMVSFPTTNRQASTTGRDLGRVHKIKRTSQHRYTPVARPPSPVPLILGSETLPSTSTKSSSYSSRAIGQVPQSTQATLQSSQSSAPPTPALPPTIQLSIVTTSFEQEPLPSPVVASPKQVSPPSPEPSPHQPHSIQQLDTTTTTTTTTLYASAISSPATGRQARRVPRIKSMSQYRYTPVARPPLPVSLILDSEELPSTSTTSSSRSSRVIRKVSEPTQSTPPTPQCSIPPTPATHQTIQLPVVTSLSEQEPSHVLTSRKQVSPPSPELSPPQPHASQQPDTTIPQTSAELIEAHVVEHVVDKQVEVIQVREVDGDNIAASSFA
ncbi:hypothetical protein BGX28_004786 [Mortierella sp. GBA30]|nr:hypothetical protein BGX28_004786 [Mortierella sp. GBA30]